MKGVLSKIKPTRQDDLYHKLDTLVEMLKSMKETDKEVVSRIEALEAKVEALESQLPTLGHSDVNAHLTMASQYARTNPSRAIEELIQAIKLLQ